jgi:parvulin-like peptidyl-prolyl isomerase
VSEPFLSRIGYHIVEVMNRGTDWVLARQILIKVRVNRSDTLRYEQLTRQLIKDIENGADFDSLARIYSDDPQVDLGEWIADQLSPPIDTVVKELQTGQLSEAMLTPYGYHQIYLREKIVEEPLTFEDLRDQIYEYLFQRELQTYFTEYVEKLKERTYVKIFDIAGP